MRRLPCIVGGLLAVTMIAALPGAQAFALPITLMEHLPAAGCHGDRPAAPSPEPVDYRCCVSGHHWAIAGVALSAPVALCHVGSRVEDLALDARSSEHLVAAIIPYSSPPGGTLLRI